MKFDKLFMILLITLFVFVVLVFTNALCSPLDLCFKSEIGETCFQAKRRTARLVANA